MALSTNSEELYGNRVEVKFSGPTAEYGKGFGSKAAALAKELARKQGAGSNPSEATVTWRVMGR